jgi:hypothetical protein
MWGFLGPVRLTAGPRRGYYFAMTTGAKIRERISELEAELEKLRVALEVCNEFEEPAPSFAPQSAVEMAKRILTAAHGGPLHYKEIHKRAAHLGFTGQSSSVRRTMSKFDDLFERAGEGMYRLKSE